MNGLSPFFLLKPFLTLEVGVKVCELLFSELALEDSFSKFNICLISLRGLESFGESTGTSPADFTVVPLSSFPQYWVEPLGHYPEQY